MSRVAFRVRIVCLAAMLSCGWVVQAQQVPGCGSLTNAYGPFDYRDPVARGERLRLVESYHFKPNVEALRNDGRGGKSIMGDLDYTLRAFPNHHRALNTVGRYALQGGRSWVNPEVRSADCYFQRAMTFTPDDAVVRMLYANYLFMAGKAGLARSRYEEALDLAPESAEVNYNAGLFYLSQGDIVRAKQLASVAYDKGYPLPGLHRMIAEAEKKEAR